MTGLPQGWTETALGDVCELLNGRAYSQPELLSEGKYPVLRVGNLFSRNAWYHSDLELDPDKYIDSGDLIYAWSASFGPRIWQGGKVIYHYHIWKCALQDQAVDKHFLYNLLLWDTAKIKGDHGVGSTMMHVTKSAMEKRQIPLPPLPEQRRIVRKLDTLSARSTTARTQLTAIEKLVERYKSGVLLAAFRGRLTSDLREPSNDSIQVTITDPFTYTQIAPASWTRHLFSEVCRIVGGSQPPKSTFVYAPQEGYIRLVQIRDYKSDAKATYIPADLARRFCSPSDIMIGRYGPPIFQILRGIEGAYNVALMKAEPTEAVDQEFLFWSHILQVSR